MTAIFRYTATTDNEPPDAGLIASDLGPTTAAYSLSDKDNTNTDRATELNAIYEGDTIEVYDETADVLVMSYTVAYVEVETQLADYPYHHIVGGDGDRGPLTAGNTIRVTHTPKPPPDPPTNVAATDGTYTDKITITWA